MVMRSQPQTHAHHDGSENWQLLVADMPSLLAVAVASCRLSAGAFGRLT